ncbi:MAG: hypothetical protein ACJ0GV_04025 [Dehalococcoidia bacterium]|tara:strand:- start:2064 stop:2690 length:627 start_codon:yes stop_codon:yes gene_type:complete
MILVITTSEINLQQHISLKNTKKIKSVGELDLTISNSVSLKDEVISFKSKGSKTELLVGLKWVKNNFDISSIIFFDYIEPINMNLLVNHIIIPLRLFSIDDPPLEWSNNPLINKIEINTLINKKIRKIIYDTNFDFFYGDILSIDKKFINTQVVDELRDLNNFDGLNHLIFTSNKFANENNIEIYNLCICKTNPMVNLKFNMLLEKLF